MMAFTDTFLAVFIATLMSQFCIFLIERYFKHRWARAADNIENKLRRMIDMGNVLKVDIKKGENGGFIVSEIVKSAGFMGKGGETQDFVFDTFDKLSVWLKTRMGG